LPVKLGWIYQIAQFANKFCHVHGFFTAYLRQYAGLMTGNGFCTGIYPQRLVNALLTD